MYPNKVIFILLLLVLVVPCFCQIKVKCKDTPITQSCAFNILKSRYHLIQVFGDASYRVSNFYEDDYNGNVEWVETRLIIPYFSEFINSKIPLPDPFVNGIFKDLKDIEWENRLDYGFGIEWRPFKAMRRSDNILLKPFDDQKFGWISHLRFYAVYFKTIFLKNAESWDWKPDNDFRIGLEFYRECNLYDDDIRYWGEYWADISWRKTNFYINDYKSWTFAFVPKIGLKFFPYKIFTILPYLTGEIAITERSEFWQNRALGGFGIRFMPFRPLSTERIGYFIRGTRVYFEVLWNLGYFCDKPSTSIPDIDFRVGINFTMNRW